MKTDKTTKHLNQYRQLGLTIAYYRKLRGMTQLQLAEAVNLSRTHISTLEAPNMQTSLSLEKLFDIADALHVPVKNLFELREKAGYSAEKYRLVQAAFFMLKTRSPYASTPII